MLAAVATRRKQEMQTTGMTCQDCLSFTATLLHFLSPFKSKQGPSALHEKHKINRRVNSFTWFFDVVSFSLLFKWRKVKLSAVELPIGMYVCGLYKIPVVRSCISCQMYFILISSTPRHFYYQLNKRRDSRDGWRPVCANDLEGWFDIWVDEGSDLWMVSIPVTNSSVLMHASSINTRIHSRFI